MDIQSQLQNLRKVLNVFNLLRERSRFDLADQYQVLEAEMLLNRVLKDLEKPDTFSVAGKTQTVRPKDRVAGFVVHFKEKIKLKKGVSKGPKPSHQ